VAAGGASNPNGGHHAEVQEALTALGHKGHTITKSKNDDRKTMYRLDAAGQQGSSTTRTGKTQA
jgi:hypothetical protein